MQVLWNSRDTNPISGYSLRNHGMRPRNFEERRRRRGLGVGSSEQLWGRFHKLFRSSDAVF